MLGVMQELSWEQEGWNPGTLGPQTSVASESAANRSGDASGFTAAMLSRSSAYMPIGSVHGYV